MLHKLTNSIKIVVISKNNQKLINGGLSSFCLPPDPELGCYPGLEQCNIYGLPQCLGPGDKNN